MKLNRGFTLVCVALASLACAVRGNLIYTDITKIKATLEKLCPESNLGLTFKLKVLDTVKFYIEVYKSMIESHLDEYPDGKGRLSRQYDTSLDGDLFEMIKKGYNKLDIISGSILKLTSAFFPGAVTENEVWLAEYLKMRQNIQILDPNRKYFRFFGFCVKTKSLNRQVLRKLKTEDGRSPRTLRKFTQKFLAPSYRMGFFTAEEHYDMTLADLIAAIRSQKGEFKPQDKFQLFLQVVDSLHLLHQYYSHCNIRPEAILFKSLNRNKELSYKEKQISIIYANDMAYSIKLGAFEHVRDFGRPCSISNRNDKVLTDLPKNSPRSKTVDSADMVARLRRLEKQYKGSSVPPADVDSRLYYVKDTARRGDFANPELDFSLNGHFELSDMFNLGLTFFEMEAQQWLGYSLFAVLELVSTELKKQRPMGHIFREDLFPQREGLVPLMLDELVNEDKELLGSVIALMMRNNLEVDTAMTPDHFVSACLTSADDALAINALFFALKMFISMTAKKKAIFSLNSNLKDFADNAADKRRQVLFSVTQLTNQEMDSKIKDIVSDDIFEIVLRKMYLPTYLEQYFETLQAITSLNLKFRTSIEKLMKDYTKRLNDMRRIKNVVLGQLVEISAEDMASMPMDVDTIQKMFHSQAVRLII